MRAARPRTGRAGRPEPAGRLLARRLFAGSRTAWPSPLQPRLQPVRSWRSTSAPCRSPDSLANLLALPAVAPAMWLGMVKAALGLRRRGAPPAGALAADCSAPVAQVPLAYLESLAERCADIAGGRLVLPLALARSTWPRRTCVIVVAIVALRRRGEASPATGGRGAGWPSGPPPGGAPRARSGSRCWSWRSRSSRSPPPRGSARRHRPAT